MQTKFITTCLLLISFIGVSQNHTYTGKVQDNKNLNTFEYLILIKNTSDTTKVFTVLTKNKEFNFSDIPAGNYKRCLIYENTNLNECKNISIDSNIINEIIIIEMSQNLDEVIINKKKPLIQNKFGVLVVNVENSPIMSSGSVFDMLSKMPSITYNITNNTFKLKGKEGIQIQIDGQTLYLTGNELSDYLKNISANDISAVEINSSPSSKYEATGTGGIINIKSKRIKKEGIYIGSSFNGTQGKYYKQSTGLKVQYNTKKDRYMVHYTNSFNTDFEEAITDRQFNITNANQNTYAKILGKTNTINSQFEHQFKKSNLLFTSTVSFYKENIYQNTNLDFLKKKLIDSTLISNQASNNKLKDFTFGLNYTITGKKSITTLKTNYINYNIDNYSNLSAYQLPSEFIYNNLQNKSPNKINLFLAQFDYEQKIDSLSSFELGLKGVFQKLQNQNNFYNVINEQSIFENSKSSDYDYKEEIFGGYIQYKRAIKKFDFTLGSRLEYNPSIGKTKKDNFKLERELTNFFPFFNIAYNYSENNNFNFSYSKRINRPSFNSLMPFTYFVDFYTKLLGNPNLEPTISQQLELQYIFKQNYIFSLNYSINKNQIFQTPIQDNLTNSTILTPLNIKNGYTLSLNSNATFDINKWWNLNINGIIFYNKVISETNNLDINSKIWTAQLITTNQFKLPKKITFELVTDYISPFIQGTYKTDNIFSLNASINKSFLDNKLKVSIVGNDILKTYKVKNTSQIENQVSTISQRFDTHWIRLSVVYRFYKGIKKDNAQDDNLSNEVKSRVR